MPESDSIVNHETERESRGVERAPAATLDDHLPIYRQTPERHREMFFIPQHRNLRFLATSSTLLPHRSRVMEDHIRRLRSQLLRRSGVAAHEA